MRKLTVAAFVSLDGVMQAPGGPEEDPTGGFKFGGWVAPHFDETAGSVIDEMFSQPFDLLLGRKTYDIFAAHWPYAPEGDPIGTLFDRITKYVATRNAGFSPTWQKSEVLRPDVATAIKELKSQDGPGLLTQGSTVLLQTLFANDLVDEVRTFTMPVILGVGKKLFASDAAPKALKLIETKISPKGVVSSRYSVSGPVETGSFEFETPTDAELERRKKLT